MSKRIESEDSQKRRSRNIKLALAVAAVVLLWYVVAILVMRQQ